MEPSDNPIASETCMYGNTLTRSVHAMAHMVRRPRHGLKWVSERINGAPPINQAIPWFSYTAIEHLSSWVQPGMKVLEWGGGGSTVFFAARGCQVVTVESHAGWAEKVRQKLVSLGPDVAARVEIRLIPAETAEPEHVRGYVEAYLDGGPWDLVIIDGIDEPYLDRMHCVRIVAAHPEKLAPGACVVLDDAWRPAYDQTPRELAALRQQKNWGLGPARWGVTRTDFYWNK